MIPDIKFCGLTRPDDVVQARSLGARYLGFVFAASARQLTVEQAAALLLVLTAAGEDTHAPSHAMAKEPWRVGV
ncbi:MAG: hypothetical protein ABIZ91_03730, partial [Gemmatimonadaceae bacterium]